MTRAPHIPSRGRLTALLGALAMFGAFSIDTMFPAFPVMAVELGVDRAAMNQVISVYMAAYAAMSLFHGPISDAIGRRPVLLTGLALFALASIGCALAPDYTWLLVFRALQGVSAGVGIIVGRAVIRDLLQGEHAQRLMSQVSMIFGLAPALAPIIGGWLVTYAHWRSIFWLLLGFGLLMLAAVALALPETHPREARVGFSAAGLWRTKRAMLGNPGFMRLAAITTLNFASLFLYISSTPAFVIDHLGLDARSFGWYFIPTISGMMLGAFTSGRLAGRLPGSRIATLGFMVCALSMVLNLTYNLWLEPPRVPWAVVPMMVNAFGVALVFPVLTLAMLDMYPRQRGAASSMQAFISLGFNALVAGVLAAQVDHSPLALAMASAVLSLSALALWRFGGPRIGD